MSGKKAKEILELKEKLERADDLRERLVQWLKSATKTDNDLGDYYELGWAFLTELEHWDKKVCPRCGSKGKDDCVICFGTGMPCAVDVEMWL